ncbi:WD repeat-containing protein 41 [Trichoplax sp. H2]|nr:WD repeat-containing protein 41 [Trichoplax sp. H2]|eukprot:RDD40388.1 WD repeat-containing protein 41 [Trichoplax sp. H2]
MIVCSDGHRIVTGSDDGTVIIWDIEDGILLHHLKQHTRPITSMIVVDESKVLITGSSDKSVCFWSLEKGRLMTHVESLIGSIKVFINIQDQNVVCAAGGGLNVFTYHGFSIHDMDMTSNLHSDIHSLLIVRREFLIAASDDNELQIFQIQFIDGNNCRVILRHRYALKTSHPEHIRHLLKISDTCFASASLDGSVVIWSIPESADNFEVTCILNNHETYKREDSQFHDFPYSVQELLSLENEFLFAAVGNGFFLFHTGRGTTLTGVVNAHPLKVTSLAFLSTLGYLVTSSQDGSVRLWSCAIDIKDDTIKKFTGVRKFLGSSLLGPKTCYGPPVLIGDCTVHAGGIEKLLNCHEFSFVSCGVDNQVILWRNHLTETEKKNDTVAKMLSSTTS